MGALTLKKNISEKMKQKKEEENGYNDQKANVKSKRFLICVNVLGSAGPLRFLVNDDDRVGGVIDACLKQYAREGRLPILRYSPDNFLLYAANAGADALNTWDTIGSSRARNFIMCKKAVQPSMTEGRSEMTKKKGINGKWKAWLNKSLSMKIPTN
ncbi:hypothetical protein Droror1_Dr00022794 [Drosera rotundifolia]